MFFKRRTKPKSPLADAIHMANNVATIANEYQRDRKYMPNKKDLRQFETLAETLIRNHSTVQRIARNMRQRARGEPEDALIFIDPMLF